ncbi:hypothetical protein OPT61_g7715 [Boeremia exigua]|uniref:Uncharacterized protein n=1 Tax=Boeremia exigua TaxID=749465 RepID=A0ACC2I144_9PLEO|nr:hypothetical protein OPT61_g7715 [Boeremia exigua]
MDAEAALDTVASEQAAGGAAAEAEVAPVQDVWSREADAALPVQTASVEESAVAVGDADEADPVEDMSVETAGETVPPTESEVAPTTEPEAALEADATAPPTDPFAGLNKKQRQRVERKLKAEAEAKEAEAATAAAKAEKDAEEFPVETLPESAATAETTPGVEAAREVSALGESTSDAPLGVVAETANPDVAQANESATVDSLQQTSSTEEPAREALTTVDSIAEDPVAEASSALEVTRTESVATESLPAEPLPTEQPIASSSSTTEQVSEEAPVVAAELVDPFKGLNKKQRQKLERKLKAEAEADAEAKRRESVVVDTAPQDAVLEDAAAPHREDAGDVGSAEDKTVPIPAAAEGISESLSGVQADVHLDAPVQEDAARDIAGPASTEPSAGDSLSEPVMQEAVTKDEASKASSAPPTEPPAAETAEAPVEEPTPIDPFKGLNKKQRQKLEKKLKAEAEAKEKEEEAQAVAEQDSIAAVEPSPEIVATTTTEPGVAVEETIQREPEPDTVDTSTAEPIIDEASVAVPSKAEPEPIEPVDPFAGLSKKKRKKLEKKLAAEAAQREADLVVAETEMPPAATDGPLAREVIEEQGRITVLEGDAALPTSATAQVTDTHVVQDKGIEEPVATEATTADATTDPTPEIITAPEHTQITEPAPQLEAATDPFAGLNKTQRKKLEKKLRAEAAKKQEDEEAARAQEVNESGKPAELVSGETADEHIVAEEFGDDSWPAEDMLDEDVAATEEAVQREVTDPADESASQAVDMSIAKSEIAEPAAAGPSVGISNSAIETAASQELKATESTGIAETISAPEEPATASKKSKKKKKGKKGDSISEPQTPVNEISEPVLSTVIAEESRDVVEDLAATAPVDAPEVPISTEAIAAEPPQVEPVLKSTEETDTATSPAIDTTESAIDPQPTDTPPQETTIAEDTASSKKSKKKAKKDKRASVAESESSTPLVTAAEDDALVSSEQEAGASPPSEEFVDAVSTPDEALVTGEVVSGPEGMADINVGDGQAMGAETRESKTEEPKIEQPETVEESPVLSKKDKKKAKKNKRVSIAEDSLPGTPLVEEDRQLGAVDEAPTVVEQNTSSAVPGVPDVEQLPSEAPVEPESTIGGEVLEGVSAIEQPTLEISASEPAIDPSATELSTSGSPKTVQDEAPAALSKKDKKKAKKAKRGSVAETSESATPFETPTAELNMFSFDAPSTTAKVTEGPATTSEVAPEVISSVPEDTVSTDKFHDVATPDVEIEEPVVDVTNKVVVQEDSASMSKKDKKKAKKAKRASALDTETSEPVTPQEVFTDAAEEQVVDEPQTEVGEASTLTTAEEQAKGDQQTVIASSDTPIEAVPDDRPPPAPVEHPEPSPSVGVQEPSLEESAPLSKSQKKKAKKAKRASTVESEVSQPATPVEEVVKELAPTPALDTPSTTEEPAAAQTPIDEEDVWTGSFTSRKDKKKAKNQKQTAIDSFLADEATRAANVSEPQPSPSTPTTSETPISFSGIPSQYLPTNTDGSVGLAITSARGLQGGADGESAAEREITLLDAAAQQQEVGKEGELGDADAGLVEDVSGLQPELVREPEILDHSKDAEAAPVETVESQSDTLPTDTTFVAETEDTVVEPVPAIEAPTTPADEENLDLATGSKKKKKNKKNKRASTLDDSIQELVETTPALDVLPDNNVAQQVTEPLVAEQEAADIPDTVDTRTDVETTEQQTSTAEPPKKVEDSQQILPSNESFQEEPVIAKEQAGEQEIQDVQPAVVPVETVADAPTLSKKDKKKAKKAKKQSGSATPFEEPLTVVEPAAVDKDVVAEPEDVVQETPKQAQAAPLVKSEQEPAELAEKLEPQQEIAESLTHRDVETPQLETQPSPESAAQLEHRPAELATQLEPRQEDVQLVADRSIDVREPLDTPATIEKDVEVAEPVQLAQDVESEAAPALSKKEKKKNRKSKKLSGLSTPAEEVAPIVAVEEVKEMITPDATESVAEAVAEPYIETVAEPSSDSKDAVAPEKLQDPAVPVEPVEAVEKSIEAPVTHQTEPIDVRAVADGTARADEAQQDTHVEADQKEEIPTTVNTTIEPVQPAEDEWGYMSKKDRKKGKKAIRSGAETPRDDTLNVSARDIESTPAVPAESIEQPESITKETAEDVVLQEAAVPESSADIPSAADATAAVPVETVQEESTAPLSKKQKKKSKKNRASGTATPAIDEEPQEQNKDLQTPTHVESESRDITVDEALQELSSESTIKPELTTNVVSTSDETGAIVDQPQEIEQAQRVVSVEEPTVSVEEAVAHVPEPAIAEPDTAASTAKKSKKKKKKSGAATPLAEEVASPAIEDAASKAIESTASMTDVVPLVEDNIVTEADRVVLSDKSTFDEVDTAPETPQVTAFNEPPIKEEDTTQTLTQQSTTDLPPADPLLPAKAAPELEETEQPALSRKLSKKEKKAEKKGAVAPLEDEVVVDETAASGQRAEAALGAALAGGAAAAAIHELRTPVDAPVIDSVVEPVIDQDELASTPSKVEPLDVVAEDESAPMPKKGKKGKKARKQSLALESTEAAGSQPVETAEPISLPEALQVDAPAVDAATSDLPLPEPTPMEVDPPATTQNVFESRGLDTHQIAASGTVALPLPEPTPMEEQTIEPLSVAPEVVERSFDNTAIPPEQNVVFESETLSMNEQMVAKSQEDFTAPLDRKASKRNKKGKSSEIPAESTVSSSQITEEVTKDATEHVLSSEPPTTIEQEVDQHSSSENVEASTSFADADRQLQLQDVESMKTTPTQAPEPSEASVVVPAVVTEPIPVSSSRDVAVQQELSVDAGRALSPVEVLEDSLTRSASKKDKKKKRNSTRDANLAEKIDDRVVEVANPVEPTTLPEQLPSFYETTYNTETNQSLTQLREDSHFESQPRALSPSLETIRSDAADLRQRSEALDAAVAASEQHKEATVSQSSSMFDIVNLLNKKDKKQVVTPNDGGLPDPATPVAEPNATVETRDRVESAVETPSRKLSKKDKKKAKRAAVEAHEHTVSVVENVAMSDAPVDVAETRSVAEPTTGAALTTDEHMHEVEAKNEVIQDPVLTPLTELTPAIVSSQSDETSLSREPAFEELPEPSRKLSKKDKKRQARLDALATDTPATTSSEPLGRKESTAVAGEQKSVQVVKPVAEDDTLQIGLQEHAREAPVTMDDRAFSKEETTIPNSAVEDVVSTPVLTRKESKKDRKKSRKSKSSPETAFEVERPATAAESLVKPQANAPSQERDIFKDMPSTATVERSQRVAYQDEPVQSDRDLSGGVPNFTATRPSLEETDTIAGRNDLSHEQTSTTEKTFDAISEDVLPTLNKKGSKKHRLAALFEKQSPEQQREAERGLTHKRSGSVKNLAERFENQSRSVTPLQIVPAKSLSRAASEDQLRSVSPYDNLERLRSASPRHDVDFAAAVAAGLNESGFDPSYVINNSSFYRSRSASRHGDRDIAADDEVATARRRASVSKFGTMGRSSTSTSPTKLSFAPNSPTKASVEPMDRTLPRGIEVPLAATETPSFDPMDVLNDPTFGRRTSPPGVLEEADPEELYAPSKNKKLKGKKRRTTDAAMTASSMRKDGEETAAETPALENPSKESRAVETPAAFTGRKLSFNGRGDEPMRVLNVLEQSPMKDRKAERSSSGEVRREREERGRTVERDGPTTMSPQLGKDHGPVASTQGNEYPFPQVMVPEAGDTAARSLKEEDGSERKSRGAAELDVEVSSQEPHKRRTHPVSFHEEQPEEKRLHKPEVQRGANLEPAWSFSALDNSATSVEESLPKVSTTQDRAVVREERQHPQGPRTPRRKTVQDARNSREIEASPALPEHPASGGIEPSPPSDFVTKERASYLFDSSPSTRTYVTSPAIAPKTPNYSPQTVKSPVRTSAHHEQVSPTRDSRPSEPYQSIFGDPSEKKDAATTPLPKRARTPGTNSLGTITENSPDDPLVIKKGRSVADAGSGERETKSLRRTERNRSFSDRMRSPPPTPTPANRKSTPSAQDGSERQTPSRDSPWHQANDPVDRSVALSPARRLPHATPEPVKQQLAEIRDSPGLRSQQSLSNISKLRSPDTERPMSSMSMASNASNHSLRRVERTQSGDLRAAARLGEVSAPGASTSTEPNLSGIALAAGATAAFAAASKLRGEGKGRRASMAETFVSRDSSRVVAAYTNNIQEAMGEAPRSPMSPTRAPSLRKRQSMQIIDLQTQLDQLAEHNQSLESARLRAEETLHAQQHQRQVDEQLVQEAVEARDRQIHQRDIEIAQLRDTLQRLQEEISRLTELNNNLTEANRNLTNDTNERYAHLQSEGQLVHQQWQTSQRELDTLRSQHQQLTRGMEGALREEIGVALDERNAEISRLERELSGARDQIKSLQKQILASKKPGESFLTIRDEDYFDSACQQLCQHVQQWVLRFSKFSDTRACRLSSDIQADARLDAATREKIDKRLDNAVLDGSDVDSLLADRVRRRDVFMAIVMSMIWEYVFTRYLFGMDREQRQKLKSLEKTLSEVGPPRAVAQWRAITLTLLSKREPFMQQRAQDTEAVVHEIYSTLSTLLSPPTHLQQQIQASLRNVMRLAVELSIEMRTQRAEYIMLPPLQPEYDVHGDLVAKVTFNASLMNERSGETTSNDDLEARGAIVKVVLFPLVVKKGDDFGEGEDEIVVCPAQVLIAKPGKKKVVRVMSGAMSLHSRASSKGRSAVSLAPESSVMDLDDTNVL